jgi:hypothetical protein
MMTLVVRYTPGGGGAEPPVVATAGVVTAPPPPLPGVMTTPPDAPAVPCLITTRLPDGTCTSCVPADTTGLGTAWITAQGSANAIAPLVQAMTFTVRLLSFRFLGVGMAAGRRE